ncbi:MAG: dioxygenase [Snodgrassella sp.]|jgi:hypothetical protein|nr:dioxygenase [Snodgrassella sp.]
MHTTTEFLKSATIGECTEILDFWLNECSLDEAPSPAIVQIWQQIFKTRGHKFNRLAILCQQWLNEESSP